MDEKIESFAKGRAIHRPAGYIKLHRAALSHLAKGKMKPPQWTVFTVLLLLAGWEPGKPNFGKVEANAARLAREWLPDWTPRYLLMIVKQLIDAGYVEKHGDWWALANYEKYNHPGNGNRVPKEEEPAEDPDPSIGNGVPMIGNRVPMIGNRFPMGLARIKAPPSLQGRLKEVRKKKDINPPTPQEGEAWVNRFPEFWSAYPKKDGKKACATYWGKLKPDDAKVDRILAGLESYKQLDKVKRGFVMDPIRWLKEERWEDEVLQSPDDDFWSAARFKRGSQ